ncbi:glycine-rich RNA-binding protein 2, mitochondrial-like isoform X3 [Wolffia australiana]
MRRLISSEIFLGRHGWRRLSSQASPRTWTLFVGGLSYDTNEAAMKDAFEQHGEVIAVNVICDRVSGRSRGFGFVKFAEEDAAMNALREMDGQWLDGRNIRVESANATQFTSEISEKNHQDSS